LAATLLSRGASKEARDRVSSAAVLMSASTVIVAINAQLLRRAPL
jgi:cation transport ATPase